MFLLLWLLTPVLWPLTLPAGRFLYSRYRRVHNAGCARAGELTEARADAEAKAR